MARFHPLKVTDVRRETRDAVVVTLAPRDEDRALFDFTQGQYLTFRRDFDGEELRRSYSICAGKDEGALRVGIKRVDGGAFSTWVNENLAPGDEIEAMPPMGKFFTPIDPGAEKQYLGFAAGSGITPVLSIIKTVLAREPRSRFTLVYANRQINTIMFREELEDLKNLHLGRFSVIHVLEQEGQEIDLFTGRIDEGKMAAMFQHWLDAEAVDTAFICGPEPMMLTVAASLREHGLRDEQIKFELFASSQPGRAKARAVSREAVKAGEGVAATVTLDGATRSFQMPREGETILEAALANSMDAPYSCKAGVCSTCRCKVVEGEVEMAVNHALEDYEVRAGYVLSCQAYPISDRVVVTYDE
ncbi:MULTISPECIES: 1,2-phenylacetyl-CoA epoxidase subunit PaaE [Paracoccus]|jgi:ring-1,2-phenylacetyl-CoA epoxidase subunit PaaE|uniref:Phenylacetate-CoA oxygenase/reductase, PaaK subunit n=1 Tax=Paracoccus denitrificans (strain Pd 1222) TaxID=318586 RepID=A1BBH3_PARDP|nr:MULTISPECIES: 1,2-phenylacetyl-CoA epoxidase subunit PaaE [Paracoccus]ABL72867.1 phenylacetate-CoA oxygenase/reductase, PaaK subunit [Paracoccus denitrificans PD1222]MBB4626346.1 ring-1,2-phenylacetyl-CoA epoxidase subunit PaaE [Paracoccus denitrificans]MCU7427449.1 phenylacetate-CoA oxygenase/reductase subunit PaaK [Paracoccus denitrificans]MDK8871195.1 phenylacetate-CoA oxygenase/reductase subunit PaaK [Paracoccus sp. SSJ]QAR29278.1 phenylacetate-CoA oxygenase/reductase subunit PaaK [Para